METAAYKKDIIKYARKFIDFFEKEFGSDESKFRFFDGDDFPEACDALGFEMDCGAAFIAADRESWSSVDGLKENINKFTDIKVIGSGLYSSWRYYNHWGTPLEAGEHTKEWFLVLLRRLIFLCEQDS